MNIQSIIHDIEIIKDAIRCGDDADALQMLEEIRQELCVIAVIP